MHINSPIVALCAIIAFSSPLCAQQSPGLTVAPQAPKTDGEMLTPTTGGSMANICEELVGFLELRQAKGTDQPRSERSGNAPAVDKPQHSSGITEPVPHGGSGRQESPIDLQAAQALAAKGDVLGCRDAARVMRRAGIAMPPGLLALAALRDEILQRKGE